MPRQIFKGKTFAAAGPLPGQLTVDNLKRWTSLRKGTFSDDFDETVTILLCTREQFTKKVPRIREALKRKKSEVQIIHHDWYEFSVFHEVLEGRAEYSMRNIEAKRNAVIREQKRIEKGRRDGEKFVNTNLFHLYIDRDYFRYQVDISRDDESSGDLGQRYTLCLWESDAKPHLYQFTAKFIKKKGDSNPSYYRPSPCSGKWRHEFNLFAEFFHIKTGIEWQDRVIKEKTMPASLFQYTPPKGGKPVGRRLRFEYRYCAEINAQLRGLPWPPLDETPTAIAREVDPQEVLIPKDDDEETNAASGCVDVADASVPEQAKTPCHDESSGAASVFAGTPQQPTPALTPSTSPDGSVENTSQGDYEALCDDETSADVNSHALEDPNSMDLDPIQTENTKNSEDTEMVVKDAARSQ